MSYYYKIPYIAGKKKCFCCNNRLTEKKKAYVMVFDRITADAKEECFEFDYCPKCDLIQLRRETYCIIKDQGFQIGLINNPNLGLEKLKEQMHKKYVVHKHKKRKNKNRHKLSTEEWLKRIKEKYDLPVATPQKKHFLNKFPIVANEIWHSNLRVYSFIMPEYSFLNYCSVCGRKLLQSSILVPINSNESAKLDGKVCNNCNYIYTKQSAELQKLLIDNPYAKDITLNGICYANYSREMQARELTDRITLYKNNYNSVLYVYDLRSDSSSIEYIIVEKKDDERIEENVLHYKHPIAREIIAANMIREKQNKATINEKEYVVSCIMEEEKIKYIPPNITLIDDEKYTRSVTNDVLLYSPITKRYELAKISIGDYNDCYLGISAFRRFVKYFGKPSVDIFVSVPSGNRSSSLQYSELNEESILKLFGYNASKKDNLSSKTRQSILCDIVDLELMTVKQVISLLGFFIDNPNENYFYARPKWQEDLDFMISYKANPDRFLIFESKS